MTDDVLRDIPIEYRERYLQLLREPALDRSQLRAEVTLYLATVKQVGLMVKLLDMRVAERLANVALALLDHTDGIADPDARQHVQAAVRYFVLEEEDEEITGVLGFDDDAQVLNAVCRAVGRPDLVMALDRSDPSPA